MLTNDALVEFQKRDTIVGIKKEEHIIEEYITADYAVGPACEDGAALSANTLQIYSEDHDNV